MYVCILSWVSGVVAFAAFDRSLAFIGHFAGTAFLISLGSFLLMWRWVKLRWLCLFIVGVLYAAWRCEQILALQLPLEQSNRLFKIEATTLSIATTPDNNRAMGKGSSGASTSRLYTFGNVSAVDYAGNPMAFAKLNIRSYGQLSPQQGQRCTFYARLKAPVGKRNPGGRDIERGYYLRQISALGYVVEHPSNQCERKDARGPFAVMRERIIASVDASALDGDSVAILKALLVGEQGAINDLQWHVFRRTGTSHLVAISGLHITLSAGLVFIVIRITLLLVFFGRFSGHITDVSLLASLAGAFSYAALADFTLPAQRALIMVFISVLGLLFRKALVSYRGLLWAAFVLLAIHPATPVSLGFWLSFAAVTILIVMRNIRASESWLSTSLRTHCFLSVGLLPVTCLLTDIVPLASPLSNLIAVPVVSFVVMPLVLLGAIGAAAGFTVNEVFWRLAMEVWGLIWSLLQYFAEWSPDVFVAFQPGTWQIALAALAVVVMLVPIIPYRGLFIAGCVLQLTFQHSEQINAGEFRLVVLDVGQGLAVIIQTANHALVYDTGPSFGSYSAGTAIVLPALKFYGISTIDQLMISHGDNDHAGGFRGLREKIAINEVMVSAENTNIASAKLCQRGQHWIWDDVTFEILSPTSGSHGTKNDLSCVLKVYSTYGSALLPGDIEWKTERALLDSQGIVLKADVLLAPHHGSKTSSTVSFVERVSPQFVVFSAGFFNRFDFPHSEVFARYLEAGASAMISSEYGALEFLVDHEKIHVNPARDPRLVWKSYEWGNSD